MANSEAKRNNLIGTLIVLFGIIAIFSYITLYKGGLTLEKRNFTKAINKHVAVVDNKIQKDIVAMKEKINEGQNNIKKVKDEFIGTTGDSEKNGKLTKIRAEVERSKEAMVQKEKLETAKIKKQTIEANKGGSSEAMGEVDNEQEKTKLHALEKVNIGLGQAYSQVESPKEKQIISKMRSTVSKLEDNPSYDSSSDQATIKASYNKLDDDSKSRIKVALFTNVDGDSIGQLRQAFGL